jgi:uncharacterized membrane protein
MASDKESSPRPRRRGRRDRNRPRAGDVSHTVHAPHVRVGFLARIRNYLLAGTLVTAPFAITIYLSWLFIDFVDGLIPKAYHPTTFLPIEYQVPGLGFLLVILGLIFIGSLTTMYLGRTIVKTSEYFLERTPVLRSVYGAIKQILETVMATKSTAFRQVVLVEYPRRGIWAIGFVSGATTGEVQNMTARRRTRHPVSCCLCPKTICSFST